MTLRILTLSEMWGFSVPEQLFSYADAYRNSSAILCQKMKDEPATFTWPYAAVVLMLAAHAVELFLKGALLKRNPSLGVWDHGHNLDTLKGEYKSRFQEAVFEWDIPFASQLTVEEWIATMIGLNPELTEGELREARAKAKTAPPSILHRYPVDRAGQEWRGVYGFEAHSFSMLLSQLGCDFERIKSHLT